MENDDPIDEQSIHHESPAGAAKGARGTAAPTASNSHSNTIRASKSQDTSQPGISAPRKGNATRRHSQRRIRSNSNMNSGLYSTSLSMSDPHYEALCRLREFLKTRSAFDVFPLSYRFIIFDTKLPVKYALATMHQNGIVYAPLFDSKKWQYAGMLTLLNIIHLIQFYHMKAETFETAAADVETFKIESLRDIERELNVPPPPLHSIHPSKPLYEACKLLIQSHAHRLPLIDYDTESSMELIASVLTLFRVLRFVSLNCSKDIHNLTYSLRSLGIGTYIDPKPDNPYHPIITATMDSTVFNVVNMFSTHGISAVPILNDDGVVLNIYETLDVTTLIRSGAYTKLDLSIQQAIQQRTSEFLGVVTCSGNESLGKLIELISRQQLHRLIVVDADGRLAGIITLGDILSYIVKDGREHHYPGATTPTASSLPTAVESSKEVEE